MASMASVPKSLHSLLHLWEVVIFHLSRVIWVRAGSGLVSFAESNYGCDLGCGRAAGQMDVCAEVKVGRNESGSRSSLDRGQGFEGVEFGSDMLAID